MTTAGHSLKNNSLMENNQSPTLPTTEAAILAVSALGDLGYVGGKPVQSSAGTSSG